MTNEDTTSIPFNLVAGDVDNSALTYSIVTQGAHGTAAFVGSAACAPVPPGVFCAQSATYTPAANYNGLDFFIWQACDNAATPACSLVASVIITVIPVDDAPINSVPGTQTTDEATPLIFSPINGNAITVSDPDDPSGVLAHIVTLGITPGAGTLSAVPDFGATFTTITPGLQYQVQGTLQGINATLDGLTFTPTATNTTATPFTLSVTSQRVASILFDTDTVNIVVRTKTTMAAVSGTATYGGGNVNFTATLTRTTAATPLAGKQVDFYLNGTLVGSGPTNGSGIATFSGPIAGTPPAGTNVGAVEAKFAGDADFVKSSATGNFVVAKRILWIKPKNQTRTRIQANPGCLTVNDLEVVTPVPANTGLVNGDTLATALTFSTTWGCSYGVANGTPARPSVAGTYNITAFGVLSQNYTIAYKTGTLTVTP